MSKLIKSKIDEVYIKLMKLGLDNLRSEEKKSIIQMLREISTTTIDEAMISQFNSLKKLKKSVLKPKKKKIRHISECMTIIKKPK